MCYMDRWFCPFLECADKDCSRRLTDAVRERAEILGLPIDQRTEKPFCFKRGEE